MKSEKDDRFLASVSHYVLLLQVSLFIILFFDGLDKFFNFLVDWKLFIAPFFASLSPFPITTTLQILGVIEMIIGLIVLRFPKIGGLLATGLFFGIIINILFLGNFYNIALIDSGLLISAVVLNRLTLLLQKTASHE